MDDVGVIKADIEDQESLNKMAAQSTVVINCVGPVSYIQCTVLELECHTTFIPAIFMHNI